MSSLFSVIICPWLGFGLPPRCPQVLWCQWGEIEPFSATLAQNRLAAREKFLEILRHGLELTDSETHSFYHWPIVTDWLTRPVRLILFYVDDIPMAKALFTKWSKQWCSKGTYDKQVTECIAVWLALIHVHTLAISFCRLSWANRRRNLLGIKDTGRTFSDDPMTINKSHSNLSSAIWSWNSSGKLSPKNTMSGLISGISASCGHLGQRGIVCNKIG